MGNAISTITAKGQVTLPVKIRSDLLWKVGSRIEWKIEGNKLVGQRIRTAAELAGCLKEPEAKGPKEKIGSAFGRASIARYRRISRQR
jgi:bifunctional DNA-binding transcriptional regulator/antitoxin component of YhaV-PrlF toxin-antitoxin module